MTINLSESFKAYDVRGIVGETITAETVRATGAAFVDVLELSGRTVLVGGDMRPSSPEFMDAFADGARTRGADVVKIGLISTDELYFACGVYDAAGVTFTASHNPAEYNGMKMAQAGAVPVSSETGLYEIRDLAQRYLAEGVPAGEREGSVEDREILADYAKHLRGLVDLSGIRPLKVVVDAGNGMAGLTTPAVLGDAELEALPLEIQPLYFELDGTFPNHPANPLEPENLRDLQAAVVEHQADLGLAFDGDVVRVDPATLMTDVPGVFAGGDAVPSERTVTVGVGHGKRAARNIDAWLNSGVDLRPPKHPIVGFDDLHLWYFGDYARREHVQLDPAERIAAFEEVVSGLDEEAAMVEAARCLSCGNCFECDGCLGSCPEDAVIKLGRGHRYRFDYAKCTGCGTCYDQCPVHAIDMVAEGRPDLPLTGPAQGSEKADDVRLGGLL